MSGKIGRTFLFRCNGYFNYQISDINKINARIRHIIKLNVIATFAELLWKLIETEYHNGSSIAYLRSMFPTAYDIRRLLILNINPFRVHLWYLFAILEIYILLSIYVRFQSREKINYQPLYIVSICLLAINIIFNVYGLSIGFVTSPLLSGNAIFYGIPMFSFGLFLREYQERIIGNFSVTTSRLLILLFSGTVLGFIEMASSDGYFSYIYVGSIIQMVALLLLCLHRPNIAGQSKTANLIVTKLRLYSTTIYIVHFIMLDMYNLFLQSFVSGIFGSFEGYLRPLIVAAMAFLTAVMCDLYKTGTKKNRKY